jgi:cell division protein FtsB
LGVAVVALLGLLAVAGVKSYHDLAMVRQHEAQLAVEIGAAEGRIDTLQQRVERLDLDPLTLERLAREDLGMVLPGDVVIVLPQEDPTSDSTP